MKRALALALYVCASVTAALGQSATPLPTPKPQFFDNNGYPLAGGLIYTCVAGSSCPGTPLATYTDATAGTPNPNPVVLDSAGRAAIWLGASTYKIVVEDASSNILWTQDNVANNSSSVAYTVPYSGAVGQSVTSALSRTFDVRDFGALCNGSNDDTAAANRAITNTPAGSVIHIGNNCNFASTIQVGQAQTLTLGPGSVTLRGSPGINVAASNVTIAGVGGVGGTSVYYFGTAADVIKEVVTSGGLYSNTVKDLLVIGPQTGGVTTMTAGFCIETNNTTNFRIADVRCSWIANGFGFSNAAQAVVTDAEIYFNEPTIGDAVFIGPQALNAITIRDLITGTQAGTVQNAGIEIQGAADVQISDSNIQAMNNDLLIDPPAFSAVSSVDVINTDLDQPANCGICIQPGASTAIVSRCRFDQVWASSGAGSGVKIDTTSGGSVNGLKFLNGHYSGNSLNGMIINTPAGTANDIAVMNSSFIANTGSGVTTLGGSHMQNLSLVGNTFGNNLEGFASGQNYGLYLSAYDLSGLAVVGNTFSGNSTSQVVDLSTDLYKVYSGNSGLDDALSTVAAAASINLTGVFNTNLLISGHTAAIATIVGGFSGRKISLQFTDASPAGLTTGGNIQAAMTVTQNQVATCTFFANDGKWHCSGPM